MVCCLCCCHYCTMFTTLINKYNFIIPILTSVVKFFSILFLYFMYMHLYNRDEVAMTVLFFVQIAIKYCYKPAFFIFNIFNGKITV